MVITTWTSSLTAASHGRKSAYGSTTVGVFLPKIFIFTPSRKIGCSIHYGSIFRSRRSMKTRHDVCPPACRLHDLIERPCSPSERNAPLDFIVHFVLKRDRNTFGHLQLAPHRHFDSNQVAAQRVQLATLKNRFKAV